MRSHSSALCKTLLLIAFVGVGIASIPFVFVSAQSERAFIRVVPGEMRVEEFDVDLKLDTGGKAAGGVDIYVQHSPNIKLVGADESGSVFAQNIISPVASETHVFEFARLRFDEGFDGNDGQLLKITFRLLASGDTFITIDVDRSEVIAYEDSVNFLQGSEGIRSVLGTSPPSSAEEGEWQEIVTQVSDDTSFSSPQEKTSGKVAFFSSPFFLITSTLATVALLTTLAIAVLAGVMWGSRRKKTSKYT